MKFLFGRNKKDKAAGNVTIQAAPPAVENTDAELAAAISLALSLYTSKSREYEETVITIQKVIKPYSPWNSKIYNLKQMPHRYPQPRIK